mmetsp:Transcript_16260/g.28466  ORF Transcript_16260/g.28466 Transcript_16260/m.28466 type:complete len:205 (-) Transcript_16260:9-623(-)
MESSKMASSPCLRKVKTIQSIPKNPNLMVLSDIGLNTVTCPLGTYSPRVSKPSSGSFSELLSRQGNSVHSIHWMDCSDPIPFMPMSNDAACSDTVSRRFSQLSSATASAVSSGELLRGSSTNLASSPSIPKSPFKTIHLESCQVSKFFSPVKNSKSSMFLSLKPLSPLLEDDEMRDEDQSLHSSDTPGSLAISQRRISNESNNL